MANIHDRAAILQQNLQDAGCSPSMTEDILRYLLSGKESDIRCALCLLRKHKQMLLLQLHDDERRIDNLDYLIYDISQQQKG